MRKILVGFMMLFASSMWQAANAGELLTLEQPRFTLIFPDGLQAEALRVADLLNHYLDQHQQQLPAAIPMRPIPILLTPSSHSSNGYVGLMPYHSRWFNRPAPFAGLDWYQALAVHEGRHMVQFQQVFDHQTGRWLNLAFGELGVGLMIGALLPNWYLEGDAVLAETDMTEAGRGRVASFDLWLRTDLLSFQDQHYEQVMLGTGFERYPYPNAYVLGYHLTRYFQQHYGNQLFDRVIERMATTQALTFDGAVTDETGWSLRDHFQRMSAEFRARWQDHLAQTSAETGLPLTPNLHDHWRSYYPLAVSSGQIFALRMDVADGSELVALDEQGGEHSLTRFANHVAGRYLGSSKTRSLFPVDQQWCWLAEESHPSLPFRETSALRCWNADSGEQTVLSQTRFTAASYQQGVFLVHEFDEQRVSRLVVLSAEGNRLQEKLLPANGQVWDIHPSADGGWVLVMQHDARKAIYLLDTTLTQMSELYRADEEFLRSPILTTHWLLYTSDASGVDQLYAMHRRSGERYLVSQARFGHYYPVWDPVGMRIVVTDYQPNGHRLIALPFPDQTEPEPGWLAASSWTPSLRLPKSEALQPISAALQSESLPTFDALPWHAHLPEWHSRYALYDGVDLSLTLLADDVFGHVSADLSLGWRPAAQDWFGSAVVRSQLASGTLMGVGAGKILDEQLGALGQLALSVQQPWHGEKGLWQSDIQPGLGVMHLFLLQGTGSLSLYQAQLDLNIAREQPLQAIMPRFQWQQQWLAQLQQPDGVTLLYNDSGLTLRGLSAKQALMVRGQWQVMSGVTLSALEPTTVYPELIDPGQAGRLNAEYRWNLGAVGRPLSRAVYWRNTELALHLQSQYQMGRWAPALGASIAPGLNLLRNSNLVVAPVLSLDYRFDSQSWHAAVRFQLGF